MNILIIHEIDWLKKVIYEPHHLAELFSMKGHNVFAIDCREPDTKNLIDGFHTLSTSISTFSRSQVLSDPKSLAEGGNALLHLHVADKIMALTILGRKPLH